MNSSRAAFSYGLFVLTLGGSLPVKKIPSYLIVQTGSLRGSVLADVQEKPIEQAEIKLVDANLSTLTDSAGNFVLLGVPAGQHTVIVRHVGFESFTGAITFRDGQQVEADFLLKVSATKLEKVEVRAPKGSLHEQRLADFNERRKSGFGRFLTAELFEQNVGRNMSELLVSRIPGVRTTGKGSKQVLVGRRDASKFGCNVQVVLNNLTMYNGFQEQAEFDINSVYASDVIGVEYYTVATTPTRFSGTAGAGGEGVVCGTIVLWTK